MRNTQGFTLIELVACIVILGVISVVALPRFLNIQKDARIAVLQGARDALATANQQVYTKAVLQSQENVVAEQLKNIDLNNDGNNDLIGYFGYIKNVVPARELAGFDPQLTINRWYGAQDKDKPYFLISFANQPVDIFHLCYVEVYYPKTAGEQIRYGIQTRDC
ncbi:type II secretion system protein [Vibrio sp. AND4]|uniref:type II secretion system protein n=1 Tax=Vibrio sp. AND4 TaxID=314289 RepID=UPI00015EFBA9|nr:type II secretion system protein [Vibrio sp. AND4]EDP59896.1 putative V10 pilin [Vibrio sp. AND4]